MSLNKNKWKFFFQVCGENGITYASWAEMIITECEQKTVIGVDYYGPCQGEDQCFKPATSLLPSS